MSIAERLQKLHEELPSTVRLVAVSKFHPVEAIEEAYAAGQRVFAESRPQEFMQKVEAFRDKGICQDIEWHFIGHLQTNKLKMVLPYVSLVQSVDSERLLNSINRWSLENGKVTDLLLEVHIASEDSKQGFSEGELTDLAGRICADPDSYAGIRVRGLMGMATLTDDVVRIEAEFRHLVSIAGKLPELQGRFSCGEMSFGMSSDYPIAVRLGATMVRVGTYIFGERQY